MRYNAGDRVLFYRFGKGGHKLAGKHVAIVIRQKYDTGRVTIKYFLDGVEKQGSVVPENLERINETKTS